MNGYQNRNKGITRKKGTFSDPKAKGSIETMISDTDMYRYDKPGQRW